MPYKKKRNYRKKRTNKVSKKSKTMKHHWNSKNRRTKRKKIKSKRKTNIQYGSGQGMGRLLHDISHNSSNLLLPTLAPSVFPINLDPAPPGGRVQNFVLDQMAPNMPAELLPELSWLDDYKKEHDGAAVASLARAWKNKDRLHPTAPTLESESKMSKKKLQQRARADKLYAKNPSYSAKDDELLGP